MGELSLAEVVPPEEKKAMWFSGERG